MERQKAQDPDLAPNPLKQAFLKRKKSTFGGPSNFDFLVLGFFIFGLVSFLVYIFSLGIFF